ncbi:hypothetical protein [Pseudomonas syringae]|uniref:hypothetical protein n=1 Tax=Pseudomonas syringae TaxID=317 RepID=UPI0011D18430|nr:hypothetical protein [Pseudomonas syringae]
MDALTRRVLREERFHAGYTLVDVPDTVQAKPPEMPEPLWLVEEQLASGEWIPIEQTSDLAEAEQKLSSAENCFSGLAYRLYRQIGTKQPTSPIAPSPKFTESPMRVL